MTALPSPISLSAEAITTPEESPFQIVLRRFRRHRMAMISIVVMAGFFILSVFAKQIAPFTPNQITVGNYFLSFGASDDKSSATHWLGTDNIGRDYFSRLLYAGRISLTVALFSVFISTSFGLLVGAYAGFYGGWLDSVVMRFVEFLLTIPILPILLIVSSILLRNEKAIPIPQAVLNAAGGLMLLDPADARQAILIVIVLAGLGWLNTAQLMRGMALALRDQTFVEASRSLGMSNAQIIVRHLIPNAMAPIIVDASLNMAGFIVGEAALSFLGFGIQDPIPTWGNMLAGTQQFMFDRPWLPLVPGTPILLCSLAFNFIGDGLRDALDPRLKM